MNEDDLILLDEFLPDVLPYVSGVPEIVAISAIRDSVIEFCRKTNYWQYDISGINVENGNAEVNLTVDFDVDVNIVKVMHVYLGDHLLIPRASDELARVYRASNWQLLEGFPQFYTQKRYSVLQLVPKPLLPSAQQLYVRVSLAPTRESREIKKEIYDHYLDTIASGAKAMLYKTPGQPYFDRASARENEIAFRAGVSEAKIEVNKSMTRTSTRIEYQRVI
jgi:hypothetical protein